MLPEQIEALGLLPRKRRKPIKAPDSAPLLHCHGMIPGAHNLGYANAERWTPAKPKGAVALELFRALTDRRDVPVEEAAYLTTLTKTPFEVEFRESDDGEIATYYGRWVTRRGEVSPWSEPLSVRVAF